MTGDSSPRLRGSPRITRIVYVVYVLLVTAFTISSIAQVSGALFQSPEREAAAAEARFPRVGAACAKLLDEHAVAIESARVAASSEGDAERAKARYARERNAAREHAPDLDRVCSADPHGTDALAALARLDRAAESHAVRTASELSPVRLAAHSFIRGHPQ